MDDDKKTWPPGTAQIIERELTEMSLKYGASTAMKDHVRSLLQLRWAHNDAFLTVLDGEGRSLPLESYFAKLKSDPIYAKEFSKIESPRISLHDEASLHAEFQAIADGRVVVGDE